VCPTLDVRLRERLADANRWTPLRAKPAPSGDKRAGRRVALATPKDTTSSSGEESTPLEKGELPAESDHVSEPSSESEEGNE